MSTAAVAAVLVRYATGIDSKDWGLLRTCFTDDCATDYGPLGVRAGADELVSWLRELHAPFDATFHRITNVEVELGRAGVASARSYVDAYLLRPGGQGGLHAVGAYEDEFVEVDGDWQIARRRYRSGFVEAVGPALTAAQREALLRG